MPRKDKDKKNGRNRIPWIDIYEGRIFPYPVFGICLEYFCCLSQVQRLLHISENKEKTTSLLLSKIYGTNDFTAEDLKTNE